MGFSKTNPESFSNISISSGILFDRRGFSKIYRNHKSFIGNLFMPSTGKNGMQDYRSIENFFKLW